MYGIYFKHKPTLVMISFEGTVKPGEHRVDQDSDDEIDGNDDDGVDRVGRLRDVNKVTSKKRNTGRKGRRR